MDSNFQAERSASILKLPEACQKRNVKCDAGRALIQVDAKFCVHCGTRNSQFNEQVAIVSHVGPRLGWKQPVHSDFNLDQLVREHFHGVRAVSEEGKQLVEDWDLKRQLEAALGSGPGAARGIVVTARAARPVVAASKASCTHECAAHFCCHFIRRGAAVGCARRQCCSVGSGKAVQAERSMAMPLCEVRQC